MTKKLTDEVLISKAKYAKRNLRILGALCGFLALLLFLLACCVNKKGGYSMYVPSLHVVYRLATGSCRWRLVVVARNLHLSRHPSWAVA